MSNNTEVSKEVATVATMKISAEDAGMISRTYFISDRVRKSARTINLVPNGFGLVATKATEKLPEDEQVKYGVFTVLIGGETYKMFSYELLGLDGVATKEADGSISVKEVIELKKPKAQVNWVTGDDLYNWSEYNYFDTVKLKIEQGHEKSYRGHEYAILSSGLKDSAVKKIEAGLLIPKQVLRA